MITLLTSINLLLGFLLSVMVGTFFWLQWHLPQDAVTGLFQEPLSGPPMLLVFGALIHLLLLRLFLMRMQDTPARDEAFPPLFPGPTSPPHRAFQWERLSAAIGLGLPAAGFGWAWDNFISEGQVWVKASGMVVNRWSPAPECPLSIFLDIGLCRYGDVANRTVATGNGIDFLPFWQPLLMVALSIAMLAMTLRILFSLSRRFPQRRRAVDKVRYLGNGS